MTTMSNLNVDDILWAFILGCVVATCYELYLMWADRQEW